ncbi:PREDICTED: uncharacterized protein LOC104772950 [Camelina sativa]|uniref:Uncharacterized protein LOC104772950 n=1 Tax=Camelina sativa TaxID=90675 RepID=A0ABM0Y5D6_CAMSA|nr:PREDICTED: uncharacterized protein LOC104772950 [Camelina sativa]
MATNAEVVDLSQSLLNINMGNITKLTSMNYITWSLQVHSLLDGHDLAGHVDGSSVPPDATITTNGRETTNPAYTIWRCQDKLVYSGLLGTLSPSIQPLVSKSKTAAEMWKIVTDTYTKPSRGHVQQIRIQLQQQSKGDKSIDDYIQNLTTRFDQLALLGKPMDHDEQIDVIFKGLSEEYKSVVDQVEGRETSPSITEIHEKLLNKEAKLLALSVSSPSHLPASANIATARNQHSQGRSNRSRTNSWHQSRQSAYKPANQTRGYQGKCQLCGVFGHSAKRCSQLQRHAYPQQGLLPSPRPWQPRENVAFTAPSSPDSWLMDSGSTHHMTSDLSNLALHQPYNGSDGILIGDGTGLPITHTGSLTLTLPSSSRNLTLNRVLCVPNIKKNLISVYRLCNANQVSVHFYPAHFQVKDLSSGVLLLEGKTRDDLYEWPVSSSTLSAFFASKPTKPSIAD